MWNCRGTSGRLLSGVRGERGSCAVTGEELFHRMLRTWNTRVADVECMGGTVVLNSTTYRYAKPALK